MRENGNVITIIQVPLKQQQSVIPQTRFYDGCHNNNHHRQNETHLYSNVRHGNNCIVKAENGNYIPKSLFFVVCYAYFLAHFFF